MRTIICLLLIAFTLSCKQKNNDATNSQAKFNIAFGSCNNHNLTNTLWDDILKNKPNVWIWGGDIIYADTEEMKVMKSYYDSLKYHTTYKDFRTKVDVLATWDDHDYGKNDAGTEFVKKDSSQQLFLDFIDVDNNDSRRKRKGVYHSKTYTIKGKSIKIILLDTRYFRTALTKDSTGVKRYIPSKDTTGTILGKTQWNWLENELKNSKANFNILMSSIQFLSKEHGWESWGNMPHEVSKMKELIVKSKARNVIILSGDRHISEISKIKVDTTENDLKYPLYDFTSSGLTHAFEQFTSEPNQYRISDVIKENNFGVLKFNLETNTVKMEIRGNDNMLLENVIQKY